MSIIHSSIMGQTDTLIEIDFTADEEPWWEEVIGYVGRGLIPGVRPCA